MLRIPDLITFDYCFPFMLMCPVCVSARARVCVSELECITVMTLIMLIAISSVSVAAANVNSAAPRCLFYVNLPACGSPGY